jgi:hypothetical protein
VAAALDAQYERGMTYLEVGRRLGDAASVAHAERLLGAIDARLDLIAAKR